MPYTAEPNTSISHGTHRLEDLIPCFIAAIDSLTEAESLSEDRDPVKYGALDDVLGAIERRINPGYYESEDAVWDMEWLFDTLDSYSPEGCYFGSHPGDGADFGWWEHE